MPDATVTEIMDALAEQVEAVLCGTADPLIQELQVEPRMVLNPTPPSIDIYPADPFTEEVGFGDSRDLLFVVRARVSTADSEGGQDLLLSMMDHRAATSVAAAVMSDHELGGLIDNIHVGGPTGFGLYPATGTDGALLGCSWTVTVIP